MNNTIERCETMLETHDFNNELTKYGYRKGFVDGVQDTITRACKILADELLNSVVYGREDEFVKQIRLKLEEDNYDSKNHDRESR